MTITIESQRPDGAVRRRDRGRRADVRPRGRHGSTACSDATARARPRLLSVVAAFRRADIRRGDRRRAAGLRERRRGRRHLLHPRRGRHRRAATTPATGSATRSTSRPAIRPDWDADYADELVDRFELPREGPDRDAVTRASDRRSGRARAGQPGPADDLRRVLPRAWTHRRATPSTTSCWPTTSPTRARSSCRPTSSRRSRRCSRRCDHRPRPAGAAGGRRRAACPRGDRHRPAPTPSTGSPRTAGARPASSSARPVGDRLRRARR